MSNHPFQSKIFVQLVSNTECEDRENWIDYLETSIWYTTQPEIWTHVFLVYTKVGPIFKLARLKENKQFLSTKARRHLQLFDSGPILSVILLQCRTPRFNKWRWWQCFLFDMSFGDWTKTEKGQNIVKAFQNCRCHQLQWMKVWGYLSDVTFNAAINPSQLLVKHFPHF